MAIAEMPVVTATKLYAQQLGLDVLVKNTFIEFAQESEPQRPARAGRSRSCPPRAGPWSAEKLGSSCADEGSSCADEDTWSATTGVPSPGTPDTSKEEQQPRHGQRMSSESSQESGCADEDEQQSRHGQPMRSESSQDSGCADEDESSASTGVPSPGQREMSNDIDAEDESSASAGVPSPGPHQTSNGIGAEAYLPSIGSRFHAEGSCKPCCFYLTNNLCKKGKDCSHCHMPHDTPKWKRVRAPKFVRNRMKKAAPATGGSTSGAGREDMTSGLGGQALGGHEDMMSGVGGHAAYRPFLPFSTAPEPWADSSWTAPLMPDNAGRPRTIVSL